MKTTGCLLIFACVCACVWAMSICARAQEGGNTIAAILALEHARYEAQSRGDKRALDQLFDDALVFVEDGLLMTKGEYLMRVQSAGARPLQIVAEAATVHLFGGTAIVVGTYREISAREDKPLPQRYRFIDTWVNKKGNWTLVAVGAAPISR
jgi:ketosteroid isomerase-like protein